MLEVLKRFYVRHFTNPEAVVLVLFLIIGFGLLILCGNMLASVITALVIAYVLEWVIKQLETLHIPRAFAIGIVYLGFLSISIISLLLLFPMLWQQMIHLIEEMPDIVSDWQEKLLLLPVQYPELISEQQVNDFIDAARKHIAQFGNNILHYSTAFVPIVTAIVVYFFLVPMMVFFMLKDKRKISLWFSNFLPAESGLVQRVWHEVHIQLGNYVRGKVGEMLIVGVASWIVFELMGLHYAMLMGVVVGISILVPYVGATVAVIPLAMIGYFQWGWSSQFIYLMVAYGVIQAIDGNIVVPILFSEAVNIHPLAIIIAIIFFGALWGFWGVFFAIPLGILIKAVLNAWPDSPTIKGE